MKLTLSREHYTTHDGGNTWTPKTPFESEDKAKEAGFANTKKWRIYPCSLCREYHVATVRKGKRVDD